MARMRFLDATRGHFGSRGVRNNRLQNDPRRRRPGYGVRPMTGGPGGLSPQAQLGWQGQLGAFAPPSLSPEAPSYLTPPPGGGVNPFTSPPPRPPAMRAGTSPRQSAFTGPIRHDMMDGKLVEPLGGMVRGAPKQPGFFGRPGVGAAMTTAGAGMMQAASQPGATFLGSLGQGLMLGQKGYTEAQRYRDEQELLKGREERDKQRLALEATKVGLEVREATGRPQSVEAMLDILEITDEAERSRWRSMPSDTALDLLSERYGVATGGAARQVASIAEWDHYQDLKKTDPAAAEQYWKSVQGGARLPSSALQINDKLAELGDSGWKLGMPMNEAQIQFMEIAKDIPGVYGGRPVSPAQEGIDEELVQDASTWGRTGRPIFDSKLSKFNEILATLDESNNITGGVVGSILESGWIPEWVKASALPSAINTLDLVQSIVFESLRDTLGPQFTENEGKRLVAASYNKYLPEEMNRTRIIRLRDEILKTAETKDGMMDWYNEHGSFVNWEDPYKLGSDVMAGHGDSSVSMAHLVIKPEDYAGIASDDMAVYIAEDISNLTKSEAQRLLLDLDDDPESPARAEMITQLWARVR